MCVLCFSDDETSPGPEVILVGVGAGLLIGFTLGLTVGFILAYKKYQNTGKFKKGLFFQRIPNNIYKSNYLMLRMFLLLSSEI